jgi:hypothetical protein
MSEAALKMQLDIVSRAELVLEAYLLARMLDTLTIPTPCLEIYGAANQTRSKMRPVCATRGCKCCWLCVQDVQVNRVNQARPSSASTPRLMAPCLVLQVNSSTSWRCQRDATTVYLPINVPTNPAFLG